MALVLHPACKVFDIFLERMGTWASHVAQERHGHLGCGMKHFAGQQLERRLVFEWKALRTIRHTGTPSKNDEKRYLSRWISISKVAVMFITSCCLYFILQSDCAACSEIGQIGYSMLRLLFHEYSHLQF